VVSKGELYFLNGSFKRIQDLNVTNICAVPNPHGSATWANRNGSAFAYLLPTCRSYWNEEDPDINSLKPELSQQSIFNQYPGISNFWVLSSVGPTLGEERHVMSEGSLKCVLTKRTQRNPTNASILTGTGRQIQ
jgi:hypothetical protein